MQLRYLFVLSFLMMTAIVSAQSAVIAYGKNTKAGKFADIRGFKMYYEVFQNPTYGYCPTLATPHPSSTVKPLTRLYMNFLKIHIGI